MVGGNDAVARGLERELAEDDRGLRSLVSTLVTLPPYFLFDGVLVLRDDLKQGIPRQGADYIDEIYHSPDQGRRQDLIREAYRCSDGNPRYRLVVLHTCARMLSDGAPNVQRTAKEVLRDFYRTLEGRTYERRIQYSH